jgi:two-component system, NarL family, sensor histidine kinase UhpB
MRLALKHQMVLAPAAVLFLLTLLLSFLQYTYWDLSQKRQESKRLGTIFIALSESDLAAQRIVNLTMRLARAESIAFAQLQEMAELHHYLSGSVEVIVTLMPLADESRTLLQQTVHDLNPERGFEAERYMAALALLRPQLVSLAELSEKQRRQLRGVHSQDFEELVARTTFVSIVVLSLAILSGIFLSLTFARRILRRIALLSDSAGRIASGEMVPPPAPSKARDELDDLALALNRMADRLIRVVSTEKLLEGAEEERRRIAMDIHDQTLSDLSNLLRAIQDLQGKSDCRVDAAKLEEDLRRAMANLREVMDNLHPQTLDILGLGAALQSHLERHPGPGGTPEYHFYASPEVDAPDVGRLTRLTLYRIAVEALHNVIKHAKASRMEINLDRRGDTLLLSVEDNGIGFDQGRLDVAASGRGLNNIRERARAVGARVAWGPSRFTSGTRFELVLTVDGAQKEA